MCIDKISCSLCGSNQIKPISNKIRNVTNNEQKMYACETCETHFISPLPQEEQLEEYYNGTFREEVHSSSYYSKEKLDLVFQRFTPEAHNRVERIKDDLSPTDEVLEIGCSVGYFLAAIEPYVQKTFGSEWDSKALAYIKEVINKNSISVSKNPQDFEQTFDKVYMFHVLEHLSDPIEFLIQLKSLLKENGQVYIEVPNVDDILVKTYQNDNFKNYYYKKAHLFNFNEKGLQYIFEKAGYQYDIKFIQRYDLSNHLHWLAKGVRGGQGIYRNILSDQVNEAYVKSLMKAKQTDTLFAVIALK